MPYRPASLLSQDLHADQRPGEGTARPLGAPRSGKRHDLHVGHWRPQRDHRREPRTVTRKLHNIAGAHYWRRNSLHLGTLHCRSLLLRVVPLRTQLEKQLPYGTCRGERTTSNTGEAGQPTARGRRANTARGVADLPLLPWGVGTTEGVSDPAARRLETGEKIHSAVYIVIWL